MEMTPVFLLVVCSASFHATVTSIHLRWFDVLKKVPCDWTEAQDECQKTQSNLTTVFDSDEADVIWTLKWRDVWLGLHHGQDNANTTWSDGVPYTFNMSTVIPSHRSQICEAIHNSTWTGFNCSDPKPFMCYNSSDYILVDVEKDWCEARKYCRRHHTDLVSISNQTQNQEVMEKGNNRSFWIGLMHDQWEWQDGACSTYREWSTFDCSGECITFRKLGMQLGLCDYSCTSCAAPLCSRGLVRIKLIRERRTWEEAFEYCKTHHTNLLWIDGPEDQTAVEQWLAIDDVTGPMWLGLRQSFVFGFWFWTSDLVVNYTNWSYNNDTNGPELPWSHQCGAIDKNGTWSDVDCLFQLPFFCEDEN